MWHQARVGVISTSGTHMEVVDCVGEEMGYAGKRSKRAEMGEVGLAAGFSFFFIFLLLFLFF